jgi:hypothetical protein
MDLPAASISFGGLIPFTVTYNVEGYGMREDDVHQ